MSRNRSQRNDQLTTGSGALDSDRDTHSGCSDGRNNDKKLASISM